MPARAMLLPVVVAPTVTSVIAFTLGVLLTWTLLHSPLAQADPTPQNGGPVVQAERIEILDCGGVVRGYLGMLDARHVLLRMGAADEQPHVSLGLINYSFSSLVVPRAACASLYATRGDSGHCYVRRILSSAGD